MKLNLGCGADIRHGYINVDKLPQNQLPGDTYRQGDISSLDWLTEDNTVDEIVAIDCLEYLTMKTVPQAVTNWVKKLKVGGVLKILVPDCHSIARSFAQGQFNLAEYSQMILGTQEHGDNRLSVIDTPTLLKILENAGMTISTKRYEGVAIYVEAVK